MKGRTWERLPQNSRNAALNRYRDWNVEHHAWWEYVYEDATTQLNYLGFESVDISFRGFWSQGDGCSFSAIWRPQSCHPAQVRENVGEGDPWIDLADRLSAIMIGARMQNIELPRLTIDKSWRGFSIDWSWTGTNLEETSMNAIGHVARDAASHIYRTLEQEHEYLTSDEVLIESFEANEYRFNFAGEMV